MKVHKVTHVEWDDGEVLWFDVSCGATNMATGRPRNIEASKEWDEVTCEDCLKKRNADTQSGEK